jgi:glycosyltransferase involved in cell wall biosynthesis
MSISVVVTYHDERPEFLREAVQSVLAQTLEPVEVVVVDDGSARPCADLVSDLGRGVRYLHQENAGLGAARNAGVAATGGEFVAFLDADDVWPPDRLRALRDALAADPGAAVASGHVTQFLSPDLDVEERRRFAVPQQPQPGLLATTMLIPRRVTDRVGPFSTARQIHQTVEWIGRLSYHGLRVVTIPQVVLLRRIHRDNFGIRRRGERGDYARALKVVLDRRRGGPSDGA